MPEVVSPIELPPASVQRAIRLSYGQAMLTAIYAASTGGMFLIGYALKLGANNVHIGLMSTLPMLCVVVQLFASALVERGVSRRRITLLGALANVACWALVILLPYAAVSATAAVRIFGLIAIIALVSLFAQVSGNARGSWIGDLIPVNFRGTFFGRLTMFAGLVGTCFALLEGALLDHIKLLGIEAFSWLFAFGMAFGLVGALLFLPQPDVPLDRSQRGIGFLRLIRQTFANRALMIVMAYTLIWSMQAVAAPFYPTYMLRDLGMPFLGVGAVNAVVTFSMLASSPFWGRVVDRYGCRPVLVACTAAIVPSQLVWVWMTSAHAVYATVPAFNLVAGVAIAGISVALSTLTYKVTPSAGRSAQFAVYSTIVVLAVSPLPTLGGYLPSWLHSIGIHADLRATFLASAFFILAAAWIARYIEEPGARDLRELVRNLPAHLRQPRTLDGPVNG